MKESYNLNMQREILSDYDIESDVSNNVLYDG